MKKVLWLLTLALIGCGESNTGSNGTGSPLPTVAVASGPLTSLGPLGVAGARMDDGGTQVLVNANAQRPASDLRLGMFTDANGSVTLNTGDGSATSAVAQSVVRGPVTSIDATRQTMRVMGLPVRLDRNTLLDGAPRLDEIGIGTQVEVYGLKLPPGEGTLATRIVVHMASPPAAVEVLGTVADFMGGTIIATPGLRIELVNTQIGSASPAGIVPVQPGIAALTLGATVRVIGTYDPASATVTASTLTTGFGPVRPEGRLTYLEGFVFGQTSTGYNVGDVAVDTTAIARPLVVGSRVRLRGTMMGGVLRVDQVTEVAPDAVIEYTVEGTITSIASIASFDVRGERIDASQAVIVNGSAASLTQGRRVRVKGVAGPGRLNATEVTILG